MQEKGQAKMIKIERDYLKNENQWSKNRKLSSQNEKYGHLESLFPNRRGEPRVRPARKARVRLKRRIKEEDKREQG